MRQDSTNNLLWFLAGLGAGVAAGMILAPAAGGDTRRFLGEKAAGAREFLEQSGREYLDKGHELYDRGRSLADEAADMFDQGRRLVDPAPEGADEGRYTSGREAL